MLMILVLLHVSMSSISKCTASHVRYHLVNGTLPKLGTVCEADLLAFYAEDELLEAAKALSSKQRPFASGCYLRYLP